MDAIKLPSKIYKIFIQVLAVDVSLLDFEQWLYKEKKLEEILPKRIFLSLLEFDYKNPSTLYELNKLLRGLLELGSVEAYEMIKLIGRLEAEGPDFPEALQDCYDLYTDGCFFLESLGLNWGLTLRVPPSQYHADSWDELSDAEKSQLLSSLDVVQIRKEVSLFKKWIQNREVVVTKRPNELSRYEYIDRRHTEERAKSGGKF